MENSISLNLKTINVKVKYPYIRWYYNNKRSGDEFLDAFNNGTMSGIVIVVQSN